MESNVSQKQANDLSHMVSNLQQAITAGTLNDEQLKLYLDMLASFSQEEITEALAKLGRGGLNWCEPFFSLALQHPEEKMVLGVVEALGTLRCAEAAQRLAQIDLKRYPPDLGKKLKKAVSRSLHRLKSAGITPAVEVTPLASATEPPVIISSRRFYKAFTTNNDRSGTIQGILIMRTSGGKYETASILFNDSKGITHTRVFSLNQRELDSYLGQCNREEEGIRLVETSLEYLNFLAGHYLALNQAEKHPVPAEFNHYCRRYLEPASEVKPHPIYKEFSLESIEEAMAFLLPRSEKLLPNPEMMHWLLEPSIITDYAQQVIARRRSKIMVTEAFFAEYKLKLTQEAVAKIFTPEFTARFISRLEHLGWVYLCAGQRQEAQLALAVAVDLKKGREPFLNPFVQALANLSLDAMVDYLENHTEKDEEQHQKPQPHSGILLLPGSGGRY